MRERFQPEYTIPIKEKLNLGTDAQQIFNEAKAGLDVWIQERVDDLMQDSRERLEALRTEVEVETEVLQDSIRKLREESSEGIDFFSRRIQSIANDGTAEQLNELTQNLRDFLQARKERYEAIGSNAIGIARKTVEKAIGIPL